MSDTTQGRDAGDGVADVRIVQEIPVIFIDGVASHFFGLGTSKFYLGRFDPDPNAKAVPKLVNILQVVMTTDGFAHLVTFLEHRLQVIVKEGAITQQRVDEIRQGLSLATASR
jgi:hypothetical protein